MTTNDDLQSIPGIREVSSFHRNFGGEDVVVRPLDADRKAFRIEALLSEGKATFPPTAPIREGDIIERVDPRGGVIEYAITRYEFNKDPFGNGSDYWEAHLLEKRHVSRRFAEPHIVIHGGINQFSVGEGNSLNQINESIAFPAVLALLENIREGIPSEALSPVQLDEVVEAIDDAASVALGPGEPSAVKRALHGVNGVIDEVASSARGGALDAIKAWARTTTALVLQSISEL